MADGQTSLLFRLLGDSSDAEKAFGDVDQAAEKTGGKLEKFSAGAAVAGAAAGAGLAVAFGQALDIEAANAKLTAQLGLTEAESEVAGKVAGDVYRAGWGESIEAVNETIRGIATNIGDVSQMSQADLQQMTTAAQVLSDTFGVDVAESTKAAGQLIKNGLAKDSTEAFDLIAAGFRDGANRSDDFLETLTEYSPQFAKLGIGGSQALALLEDGLKAGAKDTDVIADAFKEFSLRAIDGSKTTAEGYKLIGLNAKATAADIAAGGDRANEATYNVLQGLNNIKDPLVQNQAGVALFGTQWEDTLRQILPSIAEFADASDTVGGSIDTMAAQAGGSAKASIEGLQRSFSGWTQSMAESDGAMGLVVTSVGAFGPGALEAASSVGMLVAGLGSFSASAAGARVAQLASSAATGVATAAQWLWNAALSANPIGLVILAIAALVAGLIWFFTKTETGRMVFQAAMSGMMTAVNWLKDSAGKAVDWIVQKWSSMTAWFSGLTATFSRIGNTIGNALSHPFQTAFAMIRSLWNSTVGGFGFTVPNWIPFVGGNSFSIPRMATGGIVTGPTLALLGDNPAKREAVVPLERASEFGFGGGGQPAVAVHVQAGAIGSEDFLTRAITDAVEQVLRQGRATALWAGSRP